MSVRAYEIGKSNGYIDKIMESYNNPAAQKRFQRALDGLNRQVERAKKEGEKTQAAFETWQEKSDILQEAVAGKLNQTTKTVEQKREERALIKKCLTTIKYDRTIAEGRLKKAEQGASNAYAQARQAAQYLDSVQHQLTALGVGAALGPVGAVVFSAAEAGYIYTQIKNVRDAEANYESHTDALERCRRDLFLKEGGLASAKATKLTWKEIYNAVNLVLQELTKLQNNVGVMVNYFNSLSDRVEQLVERYQDEFMRVIEDGEDDEYALEELKDKVSNAYIFPGFQAISTLSQSASSSISEDEQIARGMGQMKIYHDDAQLGMVKVVYQARLTLWEELKKTYPDLTDASPLNPSLGGPPAYNSIGGL
ncbi:hypothetical protein ABW20_dc0109453 [Dactylellina cionopaga]|nr:hypothetical protein ABW20_dc0109453 [Dactylellina cionopaga]